MENYQQMMPIRQWAEDDRPREKLLRQGKNALSDAELIAILLRSGTRVQSALDLAKAILATVHNNLIELSKLTYSDLVRIHGVGEAKALSVIAALELGRRRRGADVLQKSQIKSSRDVFELMQVDLADLQHEEFWIILLSRSNHLIRKMSVSEGGLAGTIADPRKIFRFALQHAANAIILCHNHPSGSVQPSEADISITKKIHQGAKLIDLSVLDHVIIGDEQFYSFADEGMI
jgi:DNA repair protein RadC